MVFNPFGFVLGSVQAEREGITDPQARTRLGLLGGLSGSPVTGLALTTVVARREADAQAPPADGAPQPELVPVPPVRNLPLEMAKDVLTDQRLNPRQVDIVDFEHPIGQISRQDPEGGTLVSVGSTVTLFVSEGFELPDVVKPERFTIKEAQELLEDELGLVVKETKETSTEVDKDLVISQSPGGGTPVSKGDEVTLTVSEGSILLDDFLGQQAQVARDQLQDQEFRVKLVNNATYDDTKEIHEVVAQDPPGGTEVARETQVTLTINPLVLSDYSGEIYTYVREELQDFDVRSRATWTGPDTSLKDFEILDQELPAGTKVDPESLVRFTVNKPQEIT